MEKKTSEKEQTNSGAPIVILLLLLVFLLQFTGVVREEAVAFLLVISIFVLWKTIHERRLAGLLKYLIVAAYCFYYEFLTLSLSRETFDIEKVIYIGLGIFVFWYFLYHLADMVQFFSSKKNKSKQV